MKHLWKNLIGCLLLGVALSLNAVESRLSPGMGLRDVVLLALENSREVLRARLDLAKTDTDLMRFEGKYTYRALAGADIVQNRFPFNQNNIFSGTRIQTNTYNAAIEKLFITGTYFKIDVKSTRFDSNAFENSFRTPAGFGALGIPPLYTDTLSATLAQDLLKNAFGSQEKNTEKILKNQTEIKRDQAEEQIANQIVNALVDYWNFSVKDSSYETLEQLLKNTKTVRDLTIRKQSLGLSEGFEVNQWNALLAQVEGQLSQSKVEREEARRKLLRTLNLSEDTVLDKSATLVETLPAKLNVEADIEYAYKNRADFRAVSYKKENAELALSNAKNNALPSLKAAGTYGYQAQNLISPMINYTSSNIGITSMNFPVMQGSLEMVYPINDKGVFVGIRDAEIQKRQASLDEKDLIKSVSDDVRTRIDILKSSYVILENAKTTEEESKKYYSGILRSFQQGRFNAVAVKNALDTHVQDQLNLLKARVDFNINLHRYYLAKNSLFEEYGVERSSLTPEALLK